MFLTGVVKSYNSERGFGFITVDGKKDDIFFSYQGLSKSKC